MTKTYCDRCGKEMDRIPYEGVGLVNQKIVQLNATTPGQKWIAINGYTALMNFSYGSSSLRSLTSLIRGNSKQAVFNPSGGYPVKAFLNTATGEVKMFSIELFEK